MYIKKMYNGVVPNGKILNSESESLTDTYSCDYINKNIQEEIYSTEETQIGWYKKNDGTLVPLYRKIIEYNPIEPIGSRGTQTDISIPHNISNFDRCVNISITTSRNYIFPSFSSTDGQTITSATGVTEVNKTGINFRIINNDWGNIIFYFTLEYIKTTN